MSSLPVQEQQLGTVWGGDCRHRGGGAGGPGVGCGAGLPGPEAAAQGAHDATQLRQLHLLHAQLWRWGVWKVCTACNSLDSRFHLQSILVFLWGPSEENVKSAWHAWASNVLLVLGLSPCPVYLPFAVATSINKTVGLHPKRIMVTEPDNGNGN